jgi:hypothetical protein
MLQYAHFASASPRGTAAWRHHGEHIPAGDGGEVREAGETLEGAGELLVVVVFHEVLVSESADDKNSIGSI